IRSMWSTCGTCRSRIRTRPLKETPTNLPLRPRLRGRGGKRSERGEVGVDGGRDHAAEPHLTLPPLAPASDMPPPLRTARGEGFLRRLGQAMLAYSLRRLGGAIPTLFIVMTVSFFMMRLAPGGPFDRERMLAPAVEANIKKAYNLDQPLIVQYGIYLSKALK